jgi:hypothetical protein
VSLPKQPTFKYTTVVVYPAQFFPTYETPIRIAAGRYSNTGGCDSNDRHNPKRDKSWYCDTKEEAEEIAARVNKLKLVGIVARVIEV